MVYKQRPTDTRTRGVLNEDDDRHHCAIKGAEGKPVVQLLVSGRAGSCAGERSARFADSISNLLDSQSARSMRLRAAS
jgi:hypothetical protein